MSDRVRMTSKTVFQNERVTVFRADGPAEGEAAIAVTVGAEFETDLTHAKELDRLGLADPINRADLDGEGSALVPHYQVSVPDLLADQAARASSAAALSESTALELPAEGENTASSLGFDLGGAGGSDAGSNLREGFGLGSPDDLEGKTNAELREIAQAETIDLGELKRKDDIVAAIRAARASKEV